MANVCYGSLHLPSHYFFPFQKHYINILFFLFSFHSRQYTLSKSTLKIIPPPFQKSKVFCKIQKLQYLLTIECAINVPWLLDSAANCNYHHSSQASPGHLWFSNMDWFLSHILCQRPHNGGKTCQWVYKSWCISVWGHLVQLSNASLGKIHHYLLQTGIFLVGEKKYTVK